jgi:dienelactone hydrolase
MHPRLSRRELAMLTAAGVVRAEPQPGAPYTGPLDGYQDKVDLKSFDPTAWGVSRYANAKLRLTFRAKTRKEAIAWQTRLRAKLIELLGGFPKAAAAPRGITLEVREFPSYRREKFVFESRPGLTVLGYLLTPKRGKEPYPAMIAVPGHGRGVDDIVGIDDKGQPRTDKAGYQHDFALQAVEHGMAAVAIEPLGFGCRRDAAAKKNSLGTSSCQPSSGAAFLIGETMIGWRAYDVVRTIDWIGTRKELDPKRVGCMGISGGGTCTLFSAAVEPRIQVAYVSGYLNTFRASIMSISHCIDNYVPGILHWAEAYDVAGLIAPRALFVESGEFDNIFPIAASRESFERVKKVYEVFGAADKAEQEVFPGKHSFHGVRGLPFAARHLGV